MASCSEVAQLNDTTNTSSYVLGTFTPSANSILVAIVWVAGSDQSTVGTLSDVEGGWTRHTATPLFHDATKALYVFWRKVDGTPASITPTFDNGADALTGCNAVIYEAIPDAMPSGDPIRQVATAGPTTSTNPTVVFSSNLNTNNTYLAFISNGANPAAIASAPTGWTGTMDAGIASPTGGAWSAFRVTGETGTSIAATDESQFWTMLGVEVWNNEPPSNIAGRLVNSTKLKSLVGGGLA